MQQLAECIEMYNARLNEFAPELLVGKLETSSDLLELRHRLRGFLYREGVLSNPAVTDIWILDRVEEIKKGLSLYTISNE